MGHLGQLSPDLLTPPVLPDFVLDPDAVLKDTGAEWRSKYPPDYAQKRDFYEKSEL
jgi:hypothetical protein